MASRGGVAEQAWHLDLAASMTALSAVGAVAVAIDPATRTTISSTPAFTALLGRTMPDRFEELVALGVVTREEFDRVMHHIDAWRALDDLEGDGRGSSHSWSDMVTISPSGERRGEVTLHLSVVHHRRPSLGVEAVVATLESQDSANPTLRLPPTTSPAPAALWTLLDHEMRVIATDPRLADVGVDGESTIGVMASMLTHPADLANVLPAVADLITGATRVHECLARVAGVDGGWELVHVELRRLNGRDGPVVVAVQRPAGTGRRPIPLALLSTTERAVVALLFEGLRPTAIATERSVSINTVRKQLASVFHKLEVSGQAELLARYFPPPSA